ncbi:hypothetical protein QYE76_038164 [Lolium multiflorum]|uniref:Retrotransposon gag domain-containing protein n=1 Tax=Lolium multiflorum TaxID=4521 RepID=A0AAD8T7H6_LOLMU|nr:hypothetical protein QYE76_038164 [Lolium multiflorum]
MGQWARPGPGRATLCWGATTPFASFSSRTPSSRNLSHEGSSRRLQPPREAESTREKRALRRAESAGEIPSRGEIDAIAIVIELDIISIIITIVSTIYTAITTAAPRHRLKPSSKLLVNTFLLVGFDTLIYRKYYDTPLYLWVIKTIFCVAGELSAIGISMNEVRKKLFTISLSGKAAHWYKLLKNGDSIDWEDIVPLFYSKFYPPSEIHKDRNRIYNFWPHDGESIAQAWGRLKSLMLKCPIHELPGNVIIDNFYARLSFQDKTLLDTSCSGSFTRKNEEFKRDLLDRIQENTEGWENDKDRESVKDLVTENVEDGHIIFCEDASNIVSHPNKPKQVSVPMLSVRIGDHCYYGLCDIGASVSAIPYELYTEIMHEIGSCELEDIDVVIHLANRETISPIGIVRDVEVLCGIVLGHKISEKGIEVDRAKVEAIEKMPYPRDVKDRKGADNPVADNLSRLENIAYDPVPVNDSFPNEQLAVIKSHHVFVGNSKDSFFEDVVNPYMNKLKMHPKELQLVDGELRSKMSRVLREKGAWKTGWREAGTRGFQLQEDG